MLIFDQEPVDWKQLQDLVAQMFAECGCDVRVGVRVELVRGEKEIDVLVEDPETTPHSTYLCECKFWKTPIPQEVIHGFRTVIADYGAHRGFIISRAGFQKGAYTATKNTNVDLLTFHELQTQFFDRWRVAIGERYVSYADSLFPYWDYPGKMPTFKWETKHIEQHALLKEAYRPLLHIGPLFQGGGAVWQLPISLPTVDESGERNGTVTLNTYRQVYDFIEAKKDLALKQFKELHGEFDGA